MELDAQIPLLDRAAIIVAVRIWYHEDIIETTRKAILSKKSFICDDTQSKIEILVNKNIHALPLTACTKQRVQDFSAFVGKCIINWAQIHHFLTIKGTILCNLLCWNPKGVIDYVETAKKIISHERNITNCFRIACMHCLENDIFKLWDLVKHYYVLYNDYMIESFEVRFWISYIKDETSTLMNEVLYLDNRDPLWFAFDMSVRNNNEIWVEYFLMKMKEDEMRIATYRKLKHILEMAFTFNYEIIPILLHHVNDEMFNNIILSYPGTVLLQFLYYPQIHNFIKIAYKTQHVLSNEDFYRIIETIGHYLQYCESQIYINVLEQFWKISSNDCKIYVIQKCIEGSFLHRLGLRKHSSPIIKLIIQSSTADQRKEIVFSYNGILFFDSLIQKDRWGCFSMSVQEFLGSEDRKNWINELISTYKHIFETNKFCLFTSKNLEKLIHVLKEQTDKRRV